MSNCPPPHPTHPHPLKKHHSAYQAVSALPEARPLSLAVTSPGGSQASSLLTEPLSFYDLISFGCPVLLFPPGTQERALCLRLFRVLKPALAGGEGDNKGRDRICGRPKVSCQRALRAQAGWRHPTGCILLGISRVATLCTRPQEVTPALSSGAPYCICLA